MVFAAVQAKWPETRSPIVDNMSATSPRDPALLSYDDATPLFFHDLSPCTDVVGCDYPFDFPGTTWQRDFVELARQSLQLG